MMRTPAQIAESEELGHALRTSTHTLKSTVGLVRKAAGSDYVRAPARDLIEDPMARLQDLYEAYEKIATRVGQHDLGATGKANRKLGKQATRR